MAILCNSRGSSSWSKYSAGIGVPMLINAWFDETSKGKAMGIAYAGGSIGNIFLQQLVVRTYKLKRLCSLILYIWFSSTNSYNSNNIIYDKNA